MATNRDFRSTIGYVHDPRGGQQFIQQNRQIATSATNLESSFDALSGATGINVDLLRRRMVESRATAAALAQEASAYRAETEVIEAQTAAIEMQASAIQRRLALADQVRRSQEQAGSFTGDLRADLLGGATGGSAAGGGGGISERNLGSLGRAGRQLFLLPDVPISGGLSTTELSRGMILADVAAQKLNVSSLALAGTLTAVGLAFVALNAVLEPGRVATRNWANAIERFSEVAVNGTREMILAEEERARGELRIAQFRQQAFLERLQQQQGEIEGGLFGQLGLGREALGAALILNVNGFNDLKTRLEAAGASVEEINILIGLLNQETVGLAPALEDAAKGVRSFLDGIAELVRDNIAAQAEARAAAIASEFQFRQQAAQLRRTGTQEQVDALRQANVEEFTLNQERIRQLQVLAPSSRAVADEVERLTARQAELTLQNQLLAESVAPVVEQRQREARAAEALKTQTDEYFEALENTVKAQQALTAAQNAYNEAVTESDAKLAEIAANRLEREADAATSRQEAIAEAEERAGEQRVKNAENLAKQIGKIERDFARSFTDAVGNRDALAADQAKKRRDDALKDLKDGQTDQEKTVQQSLDKQLKAIEKNYQKQLKTAEDAARKAEQQERTRRDKELAIRQQTINQADVQLRNAKNAELLIYQTHFANLNNTTNSGMNAVVNAFGQGLLTMVNQVNAAFSRVNGARGGQAVQQYSSPIGPNPATGPSLNLNPFMYWPSGYSNTPVRSNAQQSSVIFAPQVRGVSRQEVRRELYGYVNRFVEAM